MTGLFSFEVSFPCDKGEHCDCHDGNCECDCHGFEKEIEPYGN